MIDSAALAARPDAPVLFVNSARCAAAAAAIMPSYVILDYEAGDRDKLDPLAGRRTDLWPDASAESKSTMARAAELLLSLGCTVRVINPNGQAPHWNIEAAVSEGWTRKQIVDFAREHLSVVERAKPPEPTSELTPAPPAEYAEYELLPAEARAPAKPKAGRRVMEAGSELELTQSWDLKCNNSKKPFSNINNVDLALAGAHRDGQGYEVWYDSFGERIRYAHGEEITDWSDMDDLKLTSWLQARTGMHALTPAIVRSGLALYAGRHERNEVTEFLDTLADLGWDGEARLCRLCSDGFGATYDDYTAAVGRCFLVGMVARAYDPGCQLDHVPVFEGSQGAGKSSALRILGGRWFSEVHESVLKKDFFISLQGVWLAEIAEMDSFRKAEMSRIKGILTDRDDRYRDVYGRAARKHPRRCVFACTTNVDNWNMDETGARRFWPIRCGKVNLAWLRANQVQLLAEAVHRYRAHESWWDVPTEAAQEHQRSRRDQDVWLDRVHAITEYMDEVTIPWVLDKLEVKVDRQDRAASMRVGPILSELGFIKSIRYSKEAGRSMRAWVRPHRVPLKSEG